MTGIIVRPYAFPHELGFNSWWDANNISLNGSILTSGGAVTAVTDYGPNGNDLSQGSGTNQPTYTINSGNGNNALTFNNNQYLSVGNSSMNNANGAMVIFMVGILSGAGTGSSYIYMSKYNNWFCGFYQRRALLTQGGVTDYLTTSAVITVGVKFSVLLRFYNAGGGVWTTDFYINETFVESKTGGLGSTSGNPLFLGGWQGTTVQNWQGTIWTAGIKFGTISTYNLQQMFRFLKARRGA